MKKQVKRQVLVIGLGRFGCAIAQTLVQDGVQVMGIDRRMDLVEEMRDSLTQAVQADSMDRDAMMALGVEHVVAKAADDFHGRMLEKLGADKILFPERDMGKRIAHNLVSGNLLEYIELSPDFSMAEILAEPDWAGKTLSELHLRDRMGINVVAVRSGEKTNPLPTSGTVIQEGDIMLVVAGEKTLLGLNKRK